MVTGSMARGTAPLYVLGHRNPDSDAVCAAVGYAALLRRQGTDEALAGIQGDLRRETRYILDRFEIDVPPLINDVRPLLHELLTSDANEAVRRLAVVSLKNGSARPDTIQILASLGDDDEQPHELREAATKVAQLLRKKARA